MTNTTNNCVSYLICCDNGVISNVGVETGLSRLQAGTLVICLIRAALVLHSELAVTENNGRRLTL